MENISRNVQMCRAGLLWWTFKCEWPESVFAQAMCLWESFTSDSKPIQITLYVVWQLDLNLPSILNM